jgi:hypothetical protein
MGRYCKYIINTVLLIDSVCYAIDKLTTNATRDDEALAITIHATIGDVLLSIRDSVNKQYKDKKTSAVSSFYRHMDIILNSTKKRLVLIQLSDQNWGFLSSSKCDAFNFVVLFIFLLICCVVAIEGRTASTINLTNHLRIHKSTYETLYRFLDNDKVKRTHPNCMACFGSVGDK